jgi:hypothetical protein
MIPCPFFVAQQSAAARIASPASCAQLGLQLLQMMTLRQMMNLSRHPMMKMTSFLLPTSWKIMSYSLSLFPLNFFTLACRKGVYTGLRCEDAPANAP